MGLNLKRALMAGLITLSLALSQAVFGQQAAFAQDAATNADAAATADASDAGTGISDLTPDQAKALAELLQDDATRGALVDALNKVSTQAGDDSGTPADVVAEAAETAEEQNISFSRAIAETTQETAENIASSLSRLWSGLSRAPDTLGSALEIDPTIILGAIQELAMVIIATVVIYNVLRMIAKRLYRRMGAAAHERGPVQTGFIILTSVLIDILVVVAAWGAGYLLATLAIGNAGQIGIQQTMYLNAFLIVEMVKMLTRALFSPTTSELRLISLPDAGARYMSRWSAFIASLLGYGQLLVVPIVNQNVNFLTGRGVSTLISVIAVLLVIYQVLRRRRTVTNWLLGERLHDRLSEGRSPLRFLATYWHVPVLIYLVVLLAIVLARPGGILFPMLGATAKVLGAVVLGYMVASLLSRLISRGVNVPTGVSQRLPLLERRLNAFVPKVLIGLRLVIVAVVALFALDTIGFIDAQSWLESQVGVQMTGMILSIAFILIFSFLIWLAVSSWIDFRLNVEFGSRPTARENTLLTLLRNAVTIVLVVITLMFVLSEIGIDIAPLIASAGVLGLAIGFGAQKLVQDIITGVFIQLENAMNVGDVVTVGGTTGSIERLTIRSVSLRDLHGVFHIIPFSSVDMVSNYMRDFGFFVADMGIAYRENVADAKQAMFDGFEELRANEEYGQHILEDLQWMGLNSFGSSDVVVRARIKTVPGQQWGVGRAYNEILKRIFDERGIEIPFPHQTIYFGEDKQGNAPAAPIRIEERAQKAKPVEDATVESDTGPVGNAPDDHAPGEDDGPDGR